MAKLLLMDIDGTLMEESPTHTLSFNYACKEIYGVDTDIESFPRHGMTDTGIMYGLLKNMGIPEKEIKNKLDIAFKTMIGYVSENIAPADYKLLDNVRNILDVLQANGHILGILTGNLEAIAKIRLEYAGIENYFVAGGYGSDNIIRSKLVDYAIQRYGKNIDRSEIYLIGDTPLDIKAAREASTGAIGIATGVYSVSDLSTADLVLKNFGEKNKLLDFLKN